jgi:hypothetical protein
VENIKLLVGEKVPREKHCCNTATPLSSGVNPVVFDLGDSSFHPLGEQRSWIYVAAFFAAAVIPIYHVPD